MLCGAMYTPAVVPDAHSHLHEPQPLTNISNMNFRKDYVLVGLVGDPDLQDAGTVTKAGKELDLVAMRYYAIIWYPARFSAYY